MIYLNYHYYLYLQIFLLKKIVYDTKLSISTEHGIIINNEIRMAINNLRIQFQ